MTYKEKNERIKAVEEKIAELQKELEDIRKEEDSCKENVSEWDFSNWNNNLAKALVSVNLPFGNLGITRYWFYDKMKFILKLIQFKYCYDKDYEPDWENERSKKYYVYYNVYDKHNTFLTDYVHNMDSKETVYFSTQEIAQKCCDWLNAGCPEGK